MAIPNFRLLHFLAFLSAVALMAGAFFFEYIMELEPCPLCMSQRIVIIAIGITALIAALHNPQGHGKRKYGAAVLLFAIIGAGLAIRQLYLQGLPPGQAPACLPSLDYLVDVLPVMELMSVMLSGTGDCAEVQWRFLGLTIPGWTLVCFIGYGCFGAIELLRKNSLAR